MWGQINVQARKVLLNLNDEKKSKMDETRD